MKCAINAMKIAKKRKRDAVSKIFPVEMEIGVNLSKIRGAFRPGYRPGVGITPVAGYDSLQSVLNLP